MSTHGWQQDDLVRQAAATRASIGQLERAIAELEGNLRMALDAESAFRADLDTLRRQQLEVRSRPYVPQRDEEGYESFGPSDEAQRQYDRLQAAIHEREEAYRRWVAARTVLVNEGPIQTAWSPRSPAGVQLRLDRLRVGQAVCRRQLAELEEQLTPGQRLEAGAVAPEYVEHRAAVERLRAQVGGAA